VAATNFHHSNLTYYQALRHSRVKLTWDDDDPERIKVTRRTLSRKEIEESDFKTYLASSGSSDEGSDVDDTSAGAAAKREKLRALLLGGGDEDNELLPEGWGKDTEKAGEMEITFTPGLSGKQDEGEGEEETTLQRYLRKQKEKRKQKKKTAKAQNEKEEGQDDEFFGEDSDDKGEDVAPVATKNGKKKPLAMESKPLKAKHVESTPAELELLLSSEAPSREPMHFDIRSVIKAEKSGSKKRGKKNRKQASRADEDEAQEDFAINVKDKRFKALFEDHEFAIDPTNPQ
jgi:NUC153 domain